MTPEMKTSYLGSIVTSTAGRDSKRLFAIVGTDESETSSAVVYIADGRLRRVEKPKKKKLIHLKFTGEVSESVRTLIEEGKLTNRSLKEILNGYRQV